MKANYAQQWVTQQKALDLGVRLAVEAGLSATEKQVIESCILAIPEDCEHGIRLDKLVGHLSNLQKAIQEKDASFLEQRRGYKIDKIIDIIEFAESKQYCNLKGSLWPTVKEDLWRIWHVQPAPFEVVLGGAAGTAKSTKSAISTAYTIYLLSTLWNPQLELEMIPTDDIFLILQSMRLSTAEEALFNRVQRMVDGSPYFSEHFLRDKKINSELIFPHFVKVKPVTGAVDAAISLNVIEYVITEINFMPVHKTSVRLEHSDKDVFDVGESMYLTLYNRSRNRFSKFIERGDFIGRGIIDSARSHVGDFTDSKIEEAKIDPTILVIERSLWGARRHEFPLHKTKWFYVQLGSDYKPPRILGSLEDADDFSSDFDMAQRLDDDYLLEALNVIKVPERYRKDFEKDIEEALKDKAGVPSRSSGRFLPFTEEIKAAQDKFNERTGNQHLFNLEEIKLQKGIAWEELINGTYLEQLNIEGEHKWAVHVDTSLGRNDALGLAVGRVIDTKIIDSGHFYDLKTQEVKEFHNVELPLYIIDGALRVLAPSGAQIDLNLIRDLILHLKKHLNICWATADWIESTSMLQAWRDNKIVSGKLSVDKSPEAYFEVKHAIKDGRILFPAIKILEEELKGLKRLSKMGSVKIDHAPGKSKDCADALAGVVSILKRTSRMRIVRQEEADEHDNATQNPNNNSSTSHPHARTMTIDNRNQGRWRRW